MRYITAMCCAVLMTAAFAPQAHADEYNKLTYVTFSGAVQVPGATLPAGTYTFKLADPENSRRVIQIWNKESSHLFTTLLTIPNQRMEASDKPVVLFKETASGQSPAVQAWFYPGERYGQEFVYPKDQAMKIAKAAHTPVLSMADNTKQDSASLRGSQVGRVDENGRFSSDDASRNEPASVTAQNTTPAPVSTSGSSQAPSSTRRELPRTASQLPMMALLSLVSLAAAFLLRRVRVGAEN
jgi:hypothetical protein